MNERIKYTFSCTIKGERTESEDNDGKLTGKWNLQ